MLERDYNILYIGHQLENHRHTDHLVEGRILSGLKPFRAFLYLVIWSPRSRFMAVPISISGPGPNWILGALWRNGFLDSEFACMFRLVRGQPGLSISTFADQQRQLKFRGI